MKKKVKKLNQPELLAPVGSMESAYAAIENGADAIFVGGKGFNARYSATNFEAEELQRLVDYCHLRGVKVYVTVNILIKQSELNELFEYLKFLAYIQVDALIIQDLGIAHIVKRHFPNLRLHGSTQMSAHSLQDVLFLQEQGFHRVVLARELQLEDFKWISAHTNIELEAFVHGALCYSYSGQCLLSSAIGGRSGNRGRCAQPCRMQYDVLKDDECIRKQEYILSPKDICTLEFVPELMESGIYSFKIEGRMKSPEYVASVVQAYRKYIEEALEQNNYHVAEEDLMNLKGVFNRGGFSKGYFYQKSGPNMITPSTPKHIGVCIGKVEHYNFKTKVATISTEYPLLPGDGLEIWNEKRKHVGKGINKPIEAGKQFTLRIEEPVEQGAKVYRSKNHTLLKEYKKTFQNNQKKLPIQCRIQGQIGEPIELSLSCGDYKVSKKGAVLEASLNNPVTKEKAKTQLMKMGSTSFKVETVTIEWPENSYIGLTDLNQLRRETVEALEKQICVRNEQALSQVYSPQTNTSQANASQTDSEVSYSIAVRTLEQLKACLKYDEVKRIYWEWEYNDKRALEALALTNSSGKAFYLALPLIIRDKEWKKYESIIKQWDNQPITGYLIRNYGSFYCLKESQLEKVIDYSLNICNLENKSYWQMLGASCETASLEIKEEVEALLDQEMEQVIYGFIPLMTTEQCVLKNINQCRCEMKEQLSTYHLKDRKGVLWPIYTHCISCKMQVLSTQPFGILKRELSTKSRRRRMTFILESGEKVEKVLDYYGGKTKEIPSISKELFKLQVE